MSAKIKRVILKLSGEALSKPGDKCIDPETLDAITANIAEAYATGVSIGIVNGAGNFVRGRQFEGQDCLQPSTADYMGMLATIINGLALRDALLSKGVPAEVFSVMPAPTFCQHYYRPTVLKQMNEEKKVIIFAGGTGHPGVTTDMCAAIRANDIEADVILKATKVDGVYDKDPEKHSDAKKYDKLTLEEAVTNKLGVMDLAALAFCMDKNIPIRVFNMANPDNLIAAIQGEDCGTLVSNH